MKNLFEITNKFKNSPINDDLYYFDEKEIN